MSSLFSRGGTGGRNEVFLKPRQNYPLVPLGVQKDLYIMKF